MALPAPLLAPNPLNDTTSAYPGAGPATRRTGYATQTAAQVGAGSTFAPQPGTGMSGGWIETPYGPMPIEQWLKRQDAYIATITEAYAASAGFEREKLASQIKDARLARNNAMEIAKLQAKTSRYGTDQQTAVQLAQLEQNQRQFEANHGLELARFGLDYAKAETDYLSTPDRFAQGMDFRQAAGRALQGLAPQPYGTDTAFTPKTADDFAVLAGGAPGGATGGAASSDPRVKALTTLFKELPPSASPGMDDNDFAVMQAAQALMSTNLQPGTLQKFRPDQRAILGSFVKRSGRSVNDFISDYNRYAPGQGSTRGA